MVLSPKQLSDRLQWISFPMEMQLVDPGEEVIAGLTRQPKTLPCRYFYDDEGSRLFERITELPEYYLTRTEQSILETYSSAIADMTGACDLVELGSGSSTKTRLLLDAYSEIDPTLRYCPIDVSAGILKDTALALLDQYPALTVLGLAGTYDQAMKSLPQSQEKPRMMMFLGSTLGNLNGQSLTGNLSEESAFLQTVAGALQSGDYFLLGVDLQKPVDIIEAAYNDTQGVTADFNLNMLTHLNRTFLGDFNRRQFEHQAQYHSTLHRIEMQLKSTVEQTVTLEALDFQLSLNAGESIRTEISRKFDLETLSQLLTQFGLPPVQVWKDENQWFSVILCQRD